MMKVGRNKEEEETIDRRNKYCQPCLVSEAGDSNNERKASKKGPGILKKLQSGIRCSLNSTSKEDEAPAALQYFLLRLPK